MIETSNKKEFTSVITIVFSGNSLECETESEYKEKIREQFHQDYEISLTDDEIKITDVQLIHGRWILINNSRVLTYPAVLL